MPLSPEEALKLYYEKREASERSAAFPTDYDKQMYVYAAEDGETIEGGGPYQFFVPQMGGKMYALVGPNPQYEAVLLKYGEMVSKDGKNFFASYTSA